LLETTPKNSKAGGDKTVVKSAQGASKPASSSAKAKEP